YWIIKNSYGTGWARFSFFYALDFFDTHLAGRRRVHVHGPRQGHVQPRLQLRLQGELLPLEQVHFHLFLCYYKRNIALGPSGQAYSLREIFSHSSCFLWSFGTTSHVSTITSSSCRSLKSTAKVIRLLHFSHWRQMEAFPSYVICTSSS